MSADFHWTCTGGHFDVSLSLGLTIGGNCLERKRERPYHSWENCYHYDHCDGPYRKIGQFSRTFRCEIDQIEFDFVGPSTNERKCSPVFTRQLTIIPVWRLEEFRLNFPLEWFSVIRRTGIVALSSQWRANSTVIGNQMTKRYETARQNKIFE